MNANVLCMSGKASTKRYSKRGAFILSKTTKTMLNVHYSALSRYEDLAHSLQLLCVGRHHPAEVLVGELATRQPVLDKETEQRHSQ